MERMSGRLSTRRFQACFHGWRTTAAEINIYWKKVVHFGAYYFDTILRRAYHQWREMVKHQKRRVSVFRIVTRRRERTQIRMHFNAWRHQMHVDKDMDRVISANTELRRMLEIESARVVRVVQCRMRNIDMRVYRERRRKTFDAWRMAVLRAQRAHRSLSMIRDPSRSSKFQTQYNAAFQMTETSNPMSRRTGSQDGHGQQSAPHATRYYDDIREELRRAATPSPTSSGTGLQSEHRQLSAPPTLYYDGLREELKRLKES